MITLFNILLTILIIPLKFAVGIFGILLFLVMFIVTLPLRLINSLLEILHTFVTPILIISAIGVDIFVINRVISGVTPLSEGIFLVVGITLTSAILWVLFTISDTILEVIDSIPSALINLASVNWF